MSRPETSGRRRDRGFANVYFDHAINRYNLIQPVAYESDTTNMSMPAGIQGGYYGALMVNEFIGLYPEVKIEELPTFNTGVSAYGAWEGGDLRRILVLNSAVYNSTANSTRDYQTIQLIGHKEQRTTVKRFYAPETSSTSGL